MPSTFSPSLRLEKIGTGEQSGTWGITTNRNIGELIDAAIAGVATIPLADADYTLTVVNGSADEARNAIVVVSGTLTAERRIFIPPASKQYTVRNATTGGFGVQVKTSTGAAVTVPAGRTLYLYCDGADCFDVKPLFLAADIISALGYTPYNAANPSAYITLAQLSPYAPINAPTFTGIPRADTATAGTSTTQLATTAFVQAAVAASTTGVSSFNGRTGAVTLATGDVTTALGFTPYNATNPSGYITAAGAPVTSVFGRTGVVVLASADVTAALGYTPYNATNPSGYIVSGALAPYLTSATAAITYAPLVSPILTGTPTAPTATPGTNTQQLATTSFVQNAIVAAAAGVSSFNGRTGAVSLTSGDVNTAIGGSPLLVPTAAATYAPIASPTFTGNVRSSNGIIWNYGYGGDGNIAVFYGNASGSQYLYNGGNAWTCTGTWYAQDFFISSDEAVKDEIEPICNPLDIVRAMDGIRFKYKKDGRRSIGFGAQQTRKVLPELVSENNEGTLTMTYGQITAVHNEALKEIAARLAAVEAR